MVCWYVLLQRVALMPLLLPMVLHRWWWWLGYGRWRS